MFNVLIHITVEVQFRTAVVALCVIVKEIVKARYSGRVSYVTSKSLSN